MRKVRVNRKLFFCLSAEASWAQVAAAQAGGFSEVSGVTSALARVCGGGGGGEWRAPARPRRPPAAPLPTHVLSVARRARCTRYERATRDPTTRPSRNRKQITTYLVPQHICVQLLLLQLLLCILFWWLCSLSVIALSADSATGVNGPSAAHGL